jgi:hypothetical protein
VPWRALAAVGLTLFFGGLRLLEMALVLLGLAVIVQPWPRRVTA